MHTIRKSPAWLGFTRNPSTGAKEFYGEFLQNAQGEDVVAGIRTPQPIAELAAWNADLAVALERASKRLEQHFHDMQDFEFTIERGKLWILQTRRGKRSGAAAVRIAVDMAKEALIDEAEALARVTPADLVVVCYVFGGTPAGPGPHDGGASPLQPVNTASGFGAAVSVTVVPVTMSLA